jgi:hypothetical protein
MTSKKISMANLYKQLIPETKHSKDIDELTKIPPPEKGDNMPHYQIFKANYLHQGDLLFMPSFNGFRYVLVITDGHTRKCNAIPIKNKDSATIIKAFDKAYKKNGILEYPTIIGFDPGSEFNNKDVKQYFTEHDVYVKFGQVNRHRSQALVEAKNYTIGNNLNKIMNAKELETGKTNKDWVQYLPKLVKLINDNLPKPITKAISDTPMITKQNNKLLDEGDMVRVALDYPKSASDNKRLHGTFRAGDLRWSRTPHEIEQVNIKPGYPPLYKIDGYKAVNYTRQQIQPVHFV